MSTIRPTTPDVCNKPRTDTSRDRPARLPFASQPGGIASALTGMSQKPQTSSITSAPTPSRPSNSRDDAAQVVKASVGEDARNVTSEALQFATDVADKASQSAQRQFASGKERAADTIGHLAGALRTTGEQLGTKDLPLVNDY